MHGKYLVIALLLAVLAVLVVGLTRLEQRRSRPVVVIAAQPPPPPFEITATREELAARAAQAKVLFRCAGDEFEHLTTASSLRGEKREAWQKFFAAGVNLGVALPGHYPTEFGATFEDYSRWLCQMGDVRLNVLRTYTILPPEFYQALAQYNFNHSDRPVYLIQGVWAEPPASGNLFEPGYTDSLKREICNAVDVVFGRAVLPERAGHAHGAYSADVSAFTLGFLFGREWESEVVRHTDTVNATVRRYEGRFIGMPVGSPTEVWLAGMMDYLTSYEVLTCSTMHPVAFVTWLPLDPLHHSTEYTSRGRPGDHDNDLVVLDPMHIQTTPAMRAGVYAAYHVYPYYPDYIFLEPAYRNYRNRHGEPDNYAGYLHYLKQHHAGMPLVVAEYGVPSARGNSHHSGLGMDHGGHNEEEQGQLNLRMLTAIYDEGLAGGIAFSWLDEWFKRNWLVDDFAVPADRVRLWHNVQNPEQCFGMVKFGRELVALDGRTDDWHGRPYARSDATLLRALWLQADEEYLYLRLDLKRSPDWSHQRVGIAIDTYDPRLGNTRLGPVGLECTNGTEFLVLLDDTNRAQVLVDSAYSLFSDPTSPVEPRYRTLAGNDGSFITQQLMNNHPRFTATGETVPAQVTEYGRLVFGRSADNSLADWYERYGIIELRLPWGVLSVSDPSSFQVIQNDTLTPGIESATTNGFAFSAFIMHDTTTGATGLVSSLPAATGARLGFTRRWRWSGWEMPRCVERLKQGYHVFAAGLAGITADSALRRTSLDRLAGISTKGIVARIARFRDDAPLAVSLTFDDGSYDLFTNALPFLSVYGFKANFGLVSDWTGPDADWHTEKNGTSFKRLGIPEVKALLADGHRVSAHGVSHEPDEMSGNAAEVLDVVRSSKAALEQALGTPVRSFHYPYSVVRPENLAAVRRSGFWFGRTAGDRHNIPASFDRFLLTSFAFYNDTLPDLAGLVRILEQGRGQWTVMLHHHVLDSTAPELATMARHGVIHTYSVTPLTFGRQMRLVRNSGAWVGPLEEVGRYLLQYRKARLDLRQSPQSATLRIDAAARDLPPVPMTVVLEIPWHWVRVTGSLADGTYSPYAGRLSLDVLPGKDVNLSRAD